MLDGAPAAAIPGLVYPIGGVGGGSRALAACWSPWPLPSLDLASVSALALWSFDAAELGFAFGFDLLTFPDGPDGGVEDMVAGWVQFLVL